MNSKKIKYIKSKKGKIPVLLSAPHSKPHKRPNLESIIKQEEKFTDDIVNEIGKHTDCSTIYTTDLAELDPSYYKINAGNVYKKLIEEMHSDCSFESFIDIHGLNPINNYDFGIYYKNRYLNSGKLAQQISFHLNQKSFKDANIQIFKFPENDQESLADFCAKELKIPSIQIEIAKYIRDDNDLRNSFASLLGKWVKKQ